MQEYFFISSCDGGLYDTRNPQWSKNPPLRAKYEYHFARIDSVAELKATLRAGEFAWPGGYRLAFYTSDGATLCFDCARKEFRQVAESIKHGLNDGWRIFACEIQHAEESDSMCDHCGNVIVECEESE